MVPAQANEARCIPPSSTHRCDISAKVLSEVVTFAVAHA